MTGALRFLVGRTARHRIAAQVRRLLQPRYAIAAGLGLVYLASLLARPPRAELAGSDVGAVALLAGSVGLFGWTAWIWTLGRASRLLHFSRAEATFLLAGPVGDARLLAYKVARGQLAILVNALLWTLLLAWSGAGLGAWRELPAAWVLLTAMQLHHLGATLVRTGGGANRRWGVEVAALAVVVLAATFAAAEMGPVLRAGWEGGVEALLPAVRTALEQPRAQLVLAPFRALVAPLTAPTLSAWAASLPAALAVLAAHAAWVVAARRRFRRSAAEAPDPARSRMQRQTWSGTLTRLRPQGPSALAITWKNVAAVVRRRRAALIAAGVVVISLACVAAARTIGPLVPQAVVGVATVWAAAFVLLGPQWVRNDLRTDLRHLDSLRTWPLGGPALVAAEVLASTAVLTGAQYALLVVVAVAALAADPASLRDVPAAGMLVAALAIPVFNWLHLLVHNGLAVLYPGWVPLGPEPRTGVEGLGQQAIVLVAGGAGLVLLLLPAGMAGGIAWSVAAALGADDGTAVWAGCAAALPAALAGSVVAVRFIGRRAARLEPGDLEREGAAQPAG